MLNLNQVSEDLAFYNYLLNLLNTKFSFPYSLGIAIIIAIFISLVKFYSKQNKDQVDERINSNSKIIMSGTILAMILISLGFGSYFYNEHYIFPDPPNDHFNVSISPFYLAEGKVDADMLPIYIKKQLNDAVGDYISVNILPKPR